MPRAEPFEPLSPDSDLLLGYPAEDLEQMATMEAAVLSFEAQRKYIPAVESLEGVVSIRRELLGSDAPEFRASVEALAMHALKWALECVRGGQHAAALELYKKTERLTDPDTVGFPRKLEARALVFQHLCAFYKMRGKHQMAMTCAEKSLRVEEQFKQGADPVRTRINYGLLLGLAQRREEAVEQLETALAMIEDSEEEDQEGTLRVVGNYNLWVELQRAGKTEAAVSRLLQAANLSRGHLKENHPLMLKVSETWNEVNEGRMAKAGPELERV